MCTGNCNAPTQRRKVQIPRQSEARYQLRITSYELRMACRKITSSLNHQIASWQLAIPIVSRRVGIPTWVGTALLPSSRSLPFTRSLKDPYH